jgi:hypothetical protein
MEDFPPEVLIYIQTVKNFFKNNEGTREYFLSQINEDTFFKYLGSISQKNFEEHGEVMLTEVQFELLRKTLIALKISEMDETELPAELSFDYELETIIYIDDRGYEKITSK